MKRTLGGRAPGADGLGWGEARELVVLAHVSVLKMANPLIEHEAGLHYAARLARRGARVPMLSGHPPRPYVRRTGTMF